MLIHQITDGKVKKTVSEFAWRKKYDGKPSRNGQWQIISTVGKAAEVSRVPSTPPTQFAPPPVVRLQARVAENAEASAATVNDTVEVDAVDPVVVGVDPITGEKVEPQPKKRGRPAKAKA